MPGFNPSATTTTNFTGAVPDFVVRAKSLDSMNAKNQDETYWYFSKAPTYFGYAFSIPEIFSAASSLCTWAYTRGWSTEDDLRKQDLEHVTGMGKDTFTQLCFNHGFVKLIVGDAFMECKWNDKRTILINMIPISPERVRLVFEKGGRLKRYDVWNGEEWRSIKKENMLHSSNKRIADQLHGTSQLEPALKIIDARNEAFDDERVIKHRDKALGIVYYQTDKTGKITNTNSLIETAVKKGEMLGLPEGTAKIEPWPARSSEDRQAWIQYCENFFYQIFGVPRSIASSDGTSEVGGKMGHVIFEPIYTKEQVDLEEDLWSQQAIKIKFNRPPSLGGLQPQLDESKNTGQQNIQPNDAAVTLNRE